jgi:hypothetical protein
MTDSAYTTWKKAGRKWARDFDRSGQTRFRPAAAASEYAQGRGLPNTKYIFRAFLEGADEYRQQQLDWQQAAHDA